MSKLSPKDIDIMIAAQMVVAAIDRLGVDTADQFDAYQRDLAAANARVAELEARVGRLKFYLIEQLWTQWEVASDRGKMTDSQMLQWNYEDMDVEPGYEHVLSDLGEENN